MNTQLAVKNTCNTPKFGEDNKEALSNLLAQLQQPVNHVLNTLQNPVNGDGEVQLIGDERILNTESRVKEVNLMGQDGGGAKFSSLNLNA